MIKCWLEEYADAIAAGFTWPDYVPALTGSQQSQFQTLFHTVSGFDVVGSPSYLGGPDNGNNITPAEVAQGWWLRYTPDIVSLGGGSLVSQCQWLKMFLEPWWHGDSTNGQALPLRVAAIVENAKGNIFAAQVTFDFQVTDVVAAMNDLLLKCVYDQRRFNFSLAARPVAVQLGHPVLKADQTFTMAARPVPVQLAHPAISL